MLARHILRYIPSLVIPAIISFGAIFCYTRLLTREDFGYYALALNTMTLLAAIFYYWLQTALPRLMPQAVREGREEGLHATSYVAFFGVSILLALGAFGYAYLAPESHVRTVILMAVPMAIARALLNINQAFHRSHLRIGRYNLIECGQAVLGLVIGLVLVMGFHSGGLGAVMGMIIGMACMVLVDARSIASVSLRHFQPVVLREIAHFGLPLVVTYGISTFLSVSDRFLVEHYCGAASLGVYAAGYTLMDRITTMMFMTIATPSFPLTVHKLEHEGVEAAQRQTYHNGVAVLLIALPACAGLLLAKGQLTALLIGSEFREGALQVMPWIAVSAILNGLATHYFDHAFYLAKKPYMLIFTQGPAALLNLALNLILIPRYGYMGAAYANVAAYALLLVLSATVGRRVFVIHFPLVAALQITAATLLMAAAVYVIAFPETFIGLVLMGGMGGAVYGAALLALNVEGARGKMRRIIGKIRK